MGRGITAFVVRPKVWLSCGRDRPFFNIEQNFRVWVFGETSPKLSKSLNFSGFPLNYTYYFGSSHKTICDSWPFKSLSTLPRPIHTFLGHQGEMMHFHHWEKLRFSQQNSTFSKILQFYRFPVLKHFYSVGTRCDDKYSVA